MAWSTIYKKKSEKESSLKYLLFITDIIRFVHIVQSNLKTILFNKQFNMVRIIFPNIIIINMFVYLYITLFSST